MVQPYQLGVPDGREESTRRPIGSDPNAHHEGDSSERQALPVLSYHSRQDVTLNSKRGNPAVDEGRAVISGAPIADGWRARRST